MIQTLLEELFMITIAQSGFCVLVQPTFRASSFNHAAFFVTFLEVLFQAMYLLNYGLTYCISTHHGPSGRVGVGGDWRSTIG